MDIELEHAIDNAADRILAARDFCGDEREAAIEGLQEYGCRVTPERLSAAFDRANIEWEACQRAAGVNNGELE